MHGANPSRHADEPLDTTKLEGRLLFDDHPRPSIDVDDVADLGIRAVPVTNPVFTIRAPQDDLERRHFQTPVRRFELSGGDPAGDNCNIQLACDAVYTTCN